MAPGIWPGFVYIDTKVSTMSNFLYYIAVVLVVLWGVGYFTYQVGSLIHVLLILAIVSVLLRLIRGKDV
jgi:hypothetical protein